MLSLSQVVKLLLLLLAELLLDAADSKQTAAVE